MWQLWTALFLLVSSTLLGQQKSEFQVSKTKRLKKTVRQELIGEGIAVKRVCFRGMRRAIGEFNQADSIFHMSKGLVLTTGNYKTIASPNTERGQSTANRNRGFRFWKKRTDAQLYDAAALQFDFYPNADYMSFNLVFASEDYPDLLNASYEDQLLILLTYPNGQQEVLAPDIGTSKINHEQNALYYINNSKLNEKIRYPTPDTFVKTIASHRLILTSKWNTKLAAVQTPIYPIEFDGMTKVLQIQAPVERHQRHRLQIAIADKGNRIFDSAVFIEMGSLVSHNQPDYKTGILAADPNYYYTIDTIARYPLTTYTSAVKHEMNCNAQEWKLNFNYDSYDLQPEHYTPLARLVNKLKHCSASSVVIQGYAAAKDEIAYNEALSKKRAEEVRDFLVRQGISYKDITLRWHSAENGNQPIPKKLSRCVEIQFKKQP